MCRRLVDEHIESKPIIILVMVLVGVTRISQTGGQRGRPKGEAKGGGQRGRPKGEPRSGEAKVVYLGSRKEEAEVEAKGELEGGSQRGSSLATH